MKILLRLFLVSLISSAFVSCRFEVPEKGNGNIVSEDIEVKEFTEIELSGNFKVIISRGTSPSVTITTDENLMKFIDVDNDGSTLHIATKKNIMSRKGVKLEIIYNDLQLIDIQGAVELTSDGVYSGDFLALNMSGAGALDMSLDLTALKVTVSGAGAVKLRGQVKEQNISMSGAGGYDAYDLISETCKVDISGVGGARVNVSEELRANVSGIGGVTYRGNPEVEKDISGLGKVSRADDD